VQTGNDSDDNSSGDEDRRAAANAVDEEDIDDTGDVDWAALMGRIGVTRNRSRRGSAASSRSIQSASSFHRLWLSLTSSTGHDDARHVAVSYRYLFFLSFALRFLCFAFSGSLRPFS